MIIAQLATIPEREPILKKVIDSLINQVDVLVVCHNDCPIYSSVYHNSWLYQKWKEFENMGDAEKFSNVEKYKDSYIFTCDDDLEYPPDYVQSMIAKIEQYKRKAIITAHGRTFRPGKIVSYYKGKLEGYPCLGTVNKDVKVDSGGTGVMAWHTDTVQVQYDWFKKPNMADIFMANEMHKRNIPIICIAHKSGWIKYLDPEQYGKTIWDKHNDNDTEQTKVYNDGH